MTVSYQHARSRIPGGTQLLSKRPEMFLPEGWPAYYAEARGCEIIALDGRRFVDMSICGIGSTVLGYADPDVDAAVMDAVRRGSMCTLNCPEEVELADLLCELHPWADMVRFARCGGEALAIAVRIARARTRRSKVVFCGYHGWHDWYLAANLAGESALDGHLLPGLDPAGVPRELAGTSIPFTYNDFDSFHAAVVTAGPELAAVVMEPARASDPAPGFLQAVREETRRRGALLVFDEVTAGFRRNTGGLHLLLGVSPDIAVFAKALSNGYPMAAVTGTGDAMNAAQDSFISSTYWTERTGPAAALATVRKHRAVNAARHLCAMGEAVQRGWRTAAADAGLAISVSGMAPLSRFAIETPDPLAARTLFTKEMLDRGFLATNAFYAMFAHTLEHVAAYTAAAREAFSAVAAAIREGVVHQRIGGPVAHGGFRRLA